MITILIADDEKLERNGIKFLLKREQEELDILEAKMQRGFCRNNRWIFCFRISKCLI